jgi:hypothetical protein
VVTECITIDEAAVEDDKGKSVEEKEIKEVELEIIEKPSKKSTMKAKELAKLSEHFKETEKE